VVDRTKTTFLDSSGINAFAAVANHGNRVVLRHPSPTVQRAIEVSGLDQIVSVET
jgi:anti-anti-sigma factor